MVAGGASGIVGMAGELKADDRLVAFMQYLRVLVVVVATPLLMAVVFPGHHAGRAGQRRRHVRRRRGLAVGDPRAAGILVAR